MQPQTAHLNTVGLSGLTYGLKTGECTEIGTKQQKGLRPTAESYIIILLLHLYCQKF